MSDVTTTSDVQRRLRISLFLLRFTISWFLLQWAVEKMISPGVTSKIFAVFYKVPLDVSVAPAIGVIQAIVVLAFLAGFMRTWSYALVTLIHGVSTLATWRSLILPFAEGSNHLFTTAVPVLAACVVLFYLRDQDTLFSIDARRAAHAKGQIALGT
jgi:putative oxidoreductase